MKRNIFFISLSIAFIANGCILEDIPEPCEDGFHEEDGQCIENPNKTEACGYPEVNCLTLEGVLTASCDSGHCVASACKDGYYPENKSTCVSGEGDKCDLNSECNPPPNAISMACIGNHCKINKCDHNYYLSGNSCIPESMNYCHSNSDCQFPNVSVAICKDNSCVIEQCKTGYRLFHGRCISASSLLCSNDDECTMLMHATSVACTKEFLCTAKLCEEDYQLKSYPNNLGAEVKLCAKENNTVCLSSDDCSKNMPVGTASMDCINNICVAQVCSEGYRTDVHSDTCVIIETKGCSTNSDCVEEGISVNAICTENVCQYTECTENYHIKDHVCVDNTSTSCGGEGEQYDCTKLPGIVEGKSQCIAGQCEAITCTPKYHLKDGQCIQNSSSNCGDSGIDCTSLPGVLPNHVECADGVCISSECDTDYHVNKVTHTCTLDTKTSCGAEEVDCTQIGAESVSCVNSTCVINTCSEGQHKKGDGCSQDTNEECGQSLKNCMEIQGISDAKCKDSHCIATACKADYHLQNGVCEQDTPTACGETAKDCKKELVTGEEVDCKDGQCIALSCKEGYHVYESQCEKDTFEVCGTSRTNCMTTGVANADCINGACIVTSCLTTYHKTGNGCILDKDNECGDTMADCTNMTGATGGSCQSGKCVASGCQKNYHKNGNVCKEDSNTECGDSKANCTTMTGATGGSCQGGKCVASGCQKNYHKNGNVCKEDSKTECGNDLIDCTLMSGAGANTKCEGGVCKATKCDSNYVLDSEGYCCYTKLFSPNAASGTYNYYCVDSIYFGTTIESAKFPYLVKIKARLFNEKNSALDTLELPKLKQVGWVELQGTKLTKLTFPSLTKVYNLITNNNTKFLFVDNSKLTTLSAPKLKIVDSVEGYVQIINNDMLTSISLGNAEIKESITIKNNARLTCQYICDNLKTVTAAYSIISGNKTTTCDINGPGNPTSKCN